MIEEEEGKGPSSPTGNLKSLNDQMCECVTTIIVGEDADEEDDEGGMRRENCETANAMAKEEQTNGKDTKDDTIEVGDETISGIGMERIKEEGADPKGEDGRRRVERSLQWFYQAISQS